LAHVRLRGIVNSPGLVGRSWPRFSFSESNVEFNGRLCRSAEMTGYKFYCFFVLIILIKPSLPLTVNEEHHALIILSRAIGVLSGSSNSFIIAFLLEGPKPGMDFISSLIAQLMAAFLAESDSI
jgi:hypothetical protein